MSQFSGNKTLLFLLDACIALVCLSGIYNSAQKTGIGSKLAGADGSVTVARVQSNSETNPLQAGDRIRSVNSHTVFTPEDVEFILDGCAIGQTIPVEFERAGQPHSVSITLSAENSLFYLVILFIVGSIFFALGVFVLKKRPARDRVALLFHFICLTVCIHIMLTFGRYTTGHFYFGYGLRGIFFLASAFTPLLFFQLSFLFPREKWQPYQKYISLLYGAAVLFFIYLTILFLTAAAGPSIAAFHRFMTAYNAGRLSFALFMFLGVANFVHSYRQSKEETERRKLRWVILGLAVGPLSFIAFWQIPQAFTSTALLPEEAILLISAVTPLAFAISIVRYHILDIDLIFNRSTVYVIVLGIVLILYTVMVALAAFIIGTFTTEISIIVSAIAAVVVALLFEPLRRLTQKFVDKKFFRVRYNYRIAQSEFTNQINRFIEFSGLAEFLVENLEKLLQPASIGFYLLGKSPNDWRLIAGHNMTGPGRAFKQEITAFTDRSLSPLMALPKYIESGVSFEKADEVLFRENRLVMILPLRLQNTKTSGFLVLGRKKSRTLYGFEDIDLLKTIVSQVSFAIERINLQKDLIIQNAETERLNELNRLKSYFVASVSHDLQTPLTSIKLFAELLQTKKGLSRTEQQEYLKIIDGESERLSRLIHNVLDFSRVERGVKEYRFETFNVADTVQSVLRYMKYQIEQNGFELDTQLPDREIIIRADGDAISQALTNLLSNAIKYTRGEKKISVSVFSENNYIVLEVKDRGIGISPDDQRRIFDTFYRSGDANVQSLAGAGLGLTLVRHIAEAHSGKITVTSNPGKGSTFRLYLPAGENE